jgi:hypothetical protein
MYRTNFTLRSYCVSLSLIRPNISGLNQMERLFLKADSVSFLLSCATLKFFRALLLMLLYISRA